MRRHSLCYTISCGFLLAGCAASDNYAWSDLEIEKVQWANTDVRSNHPALLHGMKPLPDGRFGNSIFAIRCFYIPMGLIFEFENFTEFTIIVNWERCALVDDERWTHNILHPEILEEASVQSEVVVLVAPYAMRRVPFVPRMSFREQTSRPKGRGTFHPRRQDLTESGFTERCILSLQYRDEELLYDFTMQFRPKAMESIGTAASKPADEWTRKPNNGTAAHDSKVDSASAAAGKQ